VKIIIDGDSTPFKKEIIDTAKKHGVKAVVVMNTEHFSQKNEDSYAQVLIVENEPQAADIKIMNLALPGDAVITNDMPLSYMLQGRNVSVINSRGITVSGRDMSFGMELLHEEKKMRRSGRKHAAPGGPKKHSKEDVAMLIESLELAITQGGGK
jgi:uncharacterized protein